MFVVPPYGTVVGETETVVMTGRHCGLVYACVDGPTQSAPPPDGTGFVQVRV